MKDRKINIPKLKMGLPKFWSFRIPIGNGIYLGGGKLILGSMSAVALGFIASMFVLISSGDTEIIFPDTGASYVAPGHIGTRIVDEEFPADRSQTLQINMPAGIRLDEVILKDISLGKAGLTDAFQIGFGTGFASTSTDRITIDELIIKNSSFHTMDFPNGSIYSIRIATSTIADGHTINVTMATGTQVSMASGRGATSYKAEDMTVDRVLLLQSSGSGDVLIDRLILDNVNAWTGGFNADWFEIGSLVLENVKIGLDANINTADFVINNTVSINNMTDGTQEQPIQIR